jgi:hypothetical protein
MGANLRPDSTAVNSWAINNVMKERVLVDKKLKKKTLLEIGNYKNNFSDFWVTSQISQLKTYQNKSKSVNYSW